jgi:hypothetical protein
MNGDDGMAVHLAQLRRTHRRAIRRYRSALVALFLVTLFCALAAGALWLQVHAADERVQQTAATWAGRLRDMDRRLVAARSQLVTATEAADAGRRTLEELFPLLALSPDGQVAMSGDGVLAETTDGHVLARFAAPTAVRFDAGSRLVAIATGEHDIQVLDRRGEPVAHLPALEGEITYMAFAQYQPALVAATQDGAVLLFSLQTRHAALVNIGFVPAFVAVLPDGRSFAAGRADGSVSLHSMETGQQIRRTAPLVGGGPGPVTGSVSADGRYLLITAQDGGGRLIDLQGGTHAARFERMVR